MKLQNIGINCQQNSQKQNPAFEAKAKMVLLNKEQEFSASAVSGIILGGMIQLKTQVHANKATEKGLNAVVFDFGTVSREQLEAFFKKIKIPKKIQLSFKD